MNTNSAIGQPLSLDERCAVVLDARLPVLSAREGAIHFLRALSGRAAIALANHHLLIGATIHEDKGDANYSDVVLARGVGFSSRSNIALTCRKAFDHATKGLAGKSFARCSPAVLDEVASYWNSNSSRDDARHALTFLQEIVKKCSRPKRDLLKSEDPLSRRVGLLKQYADVEAAHMSLEPYHFDAIDCAHVVAVLAILGAVVRAFDSPTASINHYNEVDVAASEAARRVFPQMVPTLLFRSVNVHDRAMQLLKTDLRESTALLHNGLLDLIRWNPEA